MGHACEFETSMRHVIHPELASEYQSIPDVPFGKNFPTATRGWTMTERSEAGHIGSPSAATSKKGELLYSCFTSGVCKFIERVRNWDGQSWDD